MVFVQIKNNIVKNVIVLDDESLLSLFQIESITNEPYDVVIRIDELSPQPGIDWTYIEEQFIAPIITTEEE